MEAKLKGTAGGVDVWLVVEWDEDPQVDARALVPPSWVEAWNAAANFLELEDIVTPYASLPIEVDGSELENNAHGIFAIAKLIWSDVKWVTPPPDLQDIESEEGVVY